MKTKTALRIWNHVVWVQIQILAMWPWTDTLTFLTLSSLLCKMGLNDMDLIRRELNETMCLEMPRTFIIGACLSVTWLLSLPLSLLISTVPSSSA